MDAKSINRTSFILLHTPATRLSLCAWRQYGFISTDTAEVYICQCSQFLEGRDQTSLIVSLSRRPILLHMHMQCVTRIRQAHPYLLGPVTAQVQDFAVAPSLLSASLDCHLQMIFEDATPNTKAFPHLR